MLQVLLDTGDALGKLVDGDDSSDSVDSSDDVVLNGVVVASFARSIEFSLVGVSL
jgi:hypothetical protein